MPGADRLERAANIDFFRGKLLPSRGTTPAAERILSAGLPQVETAPDTACVTSRATLNLSTGGVGYGCLWPASRALFYAFCAAPWWRPGPPGGAGRSGSVICFEHKAGTYNPHHAALGQLHRDSTPIDRQRRYERPPLGRMGDQRILGCDTGEGQKERAASSSARRFGPAQCGPWGSAQLRRSCKRLHRKEAERRIRPPGTGASGQAGLVTLVDLL